MIGIVAALPRELKALVAGTRPDPALRRQGIYLYRLPGAVAVAAGMGEARATAAVSAALAAATLQELWSVGLAGGCDPSVRAGTVLEATTVIDTATGVRTTTGAASGVTLATANGIAGVQEKARLHASYGAAMVDMEAATVARLACAHGLGFRAIKGISDPYDFELSALHRFTGRDGHFRTGAFALHAALRPGTWRAAAALGAASQRALAALTLTLQQALKESTQ